MQIFFSLASIFVILMTGFAHAESAECPITLREKNGANGVIVSFADEQSKDIQDSRGLNYKFPNEKYKESLFLFTNKTLKKLMPLLSDHVHKALCGSNLRIEYYYRPNTNAGLTDAGFDKIGNYERIVNLEASLMLGEETIESYYKRKEIGILEPYGKKDTIDRNQDLPFVLIKSSIFTEAELKFVYIFIHEFSHLLTFEKRQKDNPSTCRTSCDQRIKNTGDLGKKWEEMLSKNTKKLCYTYDAAFFGGNCLGAKEIRDVYRDFTNIGFPTLYSTTSMNEFTAEIYTHYLLHKLKLAEVFYQLDSHSNPISVWSETKGFAHLQIAIEFLDNRILLLSQSSSD